MKPIRAWAVVCSTFPDCISLYQHEQSAKKGRLHRAGSDCSPHRIVELVEKPVRKGKNK